MYRGQTLQVKGTYRGQKLHVRDSCLQINYHTNGQWTLHHTVCCLLTRTFKVLVNCIVLTALYNSSYSTSLLPSSLPSLSWQLFTTSETGETFSILKTLFKTLWSWPGRAGLSGSGSLNSAAQFPRKLSKLNNSHALHID